MAFDKKAYNRWYYQQHKEYWQNLNGRPVSSRKRRNTIGNYVDDYVKAAAENRKANTSSNHGQRNTIGNYAADYAKSKLDTYFQEARDKMNAAYANASYKQGRRAMRTGASVATTNRMLDKLHNDRITKIQGNAHRLALEKQRSYATGKSTLSTPRSGKIPRALRSYGSYYKIGVKSIGNSLSKAPTKIKKKLTNFFNKWLKW